VLTKVVGNSSNVLMAPYLEEHYNFSSCLFGVKAPICNFDKMLNANYAVMILTGQDFVAQFLDKLTLKLA